MTHQIIRIIVYANTKKEALENAIKILEGLIKDGSLFDYYTLFNDNTAKASGKARWGNLPSAVRLMTKEGIGLVNEGMNATIRDFKKEINLIRKKLNEEKDDDILIGDGFFRFSCLEIGEYKGSCIWVYDNEGEGIRDIEHLKEVLTKWKEYHKGENKENPYKNFDIWVIPADVHS